MSASNGPGSAPGFRPDRPAAPFGTQAESRDHQVTPGWWLAADDRWYPPHLHPNYAALLASTPTPEEGQPLAPLDSVPPIEWSTSAAISLMLSVAAITAVLTGLAVGGLLAVVALIVAGQPVRGLLDGQQQEMGGMTITANVLAVAVLLASFAL